MGIIIAWIIMAIAIIITAFILPGVEVGFVSALGAAIVLGLVNAFIRPFLLFLALPINIVTLGLFTLVINAALIMLVSAIVPGFRVHGFLPAFVFSIILTIIHMVVASLIA